MTTRYGVPESGYVYKYANEYVVGIFGEICNLVQNSKNDEINNRLTLHKMIKLWEYLNLFPQNLIFVIKIYLIFDIIGKLGL